MDHVLRRQIIAAGDLGISRLTATESTAFLQETGSRSPVDCTVHTTAPQQRIVRRVDDGIDRQRGDIALEYLYSLAHGVFSVRGSCHG